MFNLKETEAGKERGQESDKQIDFSCKRQECCLTLKWTKGK